MTANTRADALIDAMRRLTDLFQLENQAIRTRNVVALTAIADQKPVMVRTYEDSVRSVKADTETLKLMDDEAKARLKKASDDFIEASLTHARLVRAATQVTQSTITTLVAAVNKARADQSTYTRRGGMVVPSSYVRKVAPSMAYNRSF